MGKGLYNSTVTIMDFGGTNNIFADHTVYKAFIISYFRLNSIRFIKLW